MQKPKGYKIRFPQDDGLPGQHGSVAFDEKLWKMFESAPDKGRAQIEVIMKQWCKSGPNNIPSEKFKFQKHHEKSGKKIRIDEFKGWQVRFYGTTVEVDGKPMFLVTSADLSKKRTKADEKILKAAGQKAYDLIYDGKGSD